MQQWSYSHTDKITKILNFSLYRVYFSAAILGIVSKLALPQLRKSNASLFQVDLELNGEPLQIHMKLGESGEAFFVEEVGEDEAECSAHLATSPIPASRFEELYEPRRRNSLSAVEPDHGQASDYTKRRYNLMLRINTVRYLLNTTVYLQCWLPNTFPGEAYHGTSVLSELYASLGRTIDATK